MHTKFSPDVQVEKMFTECALNKPEKWKKLHTKISKCWEQWLRVCLKCSPCHPLCEGLPTALWLPWGKHDICLRRSIHLYILTCSYFSKQWKNLRLQHKRKKLFPPKIEVEPVCALKSSTCPQKWCIRHYKCYVQEQKYSPPLGVGD